MPSAECFFKDREDDASQLNRLGVAYFHVCLFPISATCYFGFSSAHSCQRFFLLPPKFGWSKETLPSPQLSF
jgi:hypothetical protein